MNKIMKLDTMWQNMNSQLISMELFLKENILLHCRFAGNQSI